MQSRYFQDHSYVETSNPSDVLSYLGEEYYLLLAETQGLIGKLDGMCRFVPNVDFYINLFMIQEVCASCGLENVTARFYDFFEISSNSKTASLPFSMLSAIKYAQGATFSESCLKTVNGILMTAQITESEYRKSDGISLDDIFLISQPIPYRWIPTEISDMVKYISKVDSQHALIEAARFQYQLEVLKPFDCYSRAIARMISMLMLKWSGLLSHPVLWISDYLEDTKIEYKDRIAATYKRDEGLLNLLWGKFFMTAVNASAKKAINQIETMEKARTQHIAMLPQISGGNKSVLRIYEYVSNAVILSVRQISDALNLSFSSVSKVVSAFESADILRQVTQKERYRQFGYVPVLDLISMAD